MDDPNICYRRILASMVSNLAINTGFVEIETSVLETLTEVLSACKTLCFNQIQLFNSFSNFLKVIYQLSLQTKFYAELQTRTEPNYHDVASALIDLGVDLNSLFKFIRTNNSQKGRNKIMKRK